MKKKPSANASRDELLSKHGIEHQDFEKTGLNWDELEAIRNHHGKATPELQTAAGYVSQRLQHVPAIHSLKVRIKSPDHLIAKIIRKKTEGSESSFSMDTYETDVTDLVGLRALHLFKDEWRPIHEFVLGTWHLHEPPIAYIRSGDPPELCEDLAAAGCNVTEHPLGYRSIHYVLRLQPEKRTYFVELQVRTIFEEGWSEIDHRVRYPRHSDDKYLAQFLAIFNRLSGSADEMGTFIKALTRSIGEQTTQLAERDRKIAEKETELKNAISALQISQKEKRRLEDQIAALRESSSPTHGFQLNTIPSTISVLSSIGTGSILGYGPRASEGSRTCMTCSKEYSEPSGLALGLSFAQCPDCRNRGGPFGLRTS